MYVSFFSAAARSPTRQWSFRACLVAHLLFLLAGFWLAHDRRVLTVPVFGLCLLTAGIVEGALLVGWRLTQVPRSQALEFLLASPLRPPLILVSEATVGILQLAFVTFAGLPVLLLLASEGHICIDDLPPLTLLPLAWGLVTGLGLTAWAYAPAVHRLWGERVLFVLILVYLVVGVMAGENLGLWIEGLPGGSGRWVLWAYYAASAQNPFHAMSDSLELPPAAARSRWLPMTLAGLTVAALALARSAQRLKGHYHERHYSPIFDPKNQHRPEVGDRPLSWWAVKRVSEYSGKVNLWLAGGFGLLYAAHTVAGPHWPAWLGRQAFVVFDDSFGIAGVAAALVVLAAVPAAFQYGLWDSSAQDRCRRLELLLLTRLEAGDFWHAALSAAWRRGQGYVAVAALLWTAAVLGGRMTAAQAVAALAAGVLLWLLYFTLGFRAFVRGTQANTLGLVLTALLPLATFALFRAGWPHLAALTPPGGLYAAGAGAEPLSCLASLAAAAGLTLTVRRRTVAGCDKALRAWYEKFHGQGVVN